MHYLSNSPNEVFLFLRRLYCMPARDRRYSPGPTGIRPIPAQLIFKSSVRPRFQSF